MLSKTPEYTREEVKYDAAHKYYVVCPDCVYGHYQSLIDDFTCWECKTRRCSLCMSSNHSSNKCLEQKIEFADLKF